MREACGDDGTKRIGERAQHGDSAHDGQLPDDVDGGRAEQRDERRGDLCRDARQPGRAEDHAPQAPRGRGEADERREARDDDDDAHGRDADLQCRGHAERPADARGDGAEEHDRRERARRRTHAHDREAGEEDPELVAPGPQRGAIRRDDLIVTEHEDRGGAEEHEEVSGRVARRLRDPALQRDDRAEGPWEPALYLDELARRRGRSRRVEVNARAGRLRLRARERAREQERGDPDGEDHREEDEQRVALPHRDVVLRCVAIAVDAWAATRLARPRRASAITVRPSTKKKACDVSLVAARSMLLSAAANSPPRVATWNARNASEGSARTAATIHSQPTEGSPVTRRITASRNPSGSVCGGMAERRRCVARSSGSRSSGSLRLIRTSLWRARPDANGARRAHGAGASSRYRAGCRACRRPLDTRAAACGAAPARRDRPAAALPWRRRLPRAPRGAPPSPRGPPQAPPATPEAPRPATRARASAARSSGSRSSRSGTATGRTEARRRIGGGRGRRG